jgi:hypothetical protein
MHGRMMFRCDPSARVCGALSAVTSTPARYRTGKSEGPVAWDVAIIRMTACRPSDRAAERYISGCAALLVELPSSSRPLCWRRGREFEPIIEPEHRCRHAGTDKRRKFDHDVMSLIRRARLRSRRTCWAGCLMIVSYGSSPGSSLASRSPLHHRCGAQRPRVGWANHDAPQGRDHPT